MKAPEELLEETLADMDIGDETWTVPWAMHTVNGELMLNGNYSTHHSPGGTVSMRVIKKSYGYIVDITECKDYKWPKKSEYVSNHEKLPVVDLIR